ncbi:MAG: ATP-binding cassette domain-containing protein, partial [Candidatus Borkfalkiaceae bacterium]|nr:ATP-binding cassette domain-containing protein [Clostridia bacterium]MDY6223989.1 ATP-binding cassette domain-containing protein [Christensenellaceae bacterium]
SGEVIGGGVTFGYMLQKDELFPWRTIEKNVFLPLEIKKINTAERRAKVVALAEKYGLKDFMKSYPAELSGGMRQRAALIRTLASEPDVLLLDEPFSALDYQTRLNVCDDVYRIIRSEKKTAILITHDISEAVSVADEALVLSCRPATLVSEYALPFGEETPLKRRENPLFSVWFEKLWKDLNV